MTTSFVDPPAPVAVGSRREEVLALLRAADGPLSAAQVAETTGLHLNTARFHLDGLVEEGLAMRASEPRDVPGRPRILYSADGPVPGPRSYGLLAEMLTGLVASLKDAGPAAAHAGRAWGGHLVERSAPSERISAGEAVTRLNRVLDAVGFAPEARTTKQGTEVLLHHCPFREVAVQQRDVVCSLHLGLIRGVLDEVRAPLHANRLDPFVEPTVCLAHLSPLGDRPNGPGVGQQAPPPG